MLPNPFKFIFGYGITLYVAWAGLLFFSSEPTNTTPIHQTAETFGHYGTAIMFLAAAACSTWGLVHRNIWWLIPQAAALVVATIGGINAAVVGHYADGVARPWQFILADQLPFIVASFFFLFALFWAFVAEDRS